MHGAGGDTEDGSRIADKVIHAILRNHSSRDARKLKLLVLQMQAQITSDDAHIAELQGQNISLHLEKARLEALVATHSVHKGNNTVDYRKKRAFKIDNVDCPEQRAPALQSPLSNAVSGPGVVSMP